MIIESTQTGRFASKGHVKPLQQPGEGVPEGAAYNVTQNKAQMIAAIRAVDYDTQCTVIDAVKDDRLLVRYTFRPGSSGHATSESYDKHLARLANAVKKTPAHYWR